MYLSACRPLGYVYTTFDFGQSFVALTRDIHLRELSTGGSSNLTLNTNCNCWWFIRSRYSFILENQIHRISQYKIFTRDFVKYFLTFCSILAITKTRIKNICWRYSWLSRIPSQPIHPSSNIYKSKSKQYLKNFYLLGYWLKCLPDKGFTLCGKQFALSASRHYQKIERNTQIRDSSAIHKQWKPVCLQLPAHVCVCCKHVVFCH